MAILAYAAEQSLTAQSRVVGVGLVSTAAGGLASAGVGRLLSTPAVACMRLVSQRAPRLFGRGWSLSRRLLAPLVGTTNSAIPAYPKAAGSTLPETIDGTSITAVATFLGEFKSFDETGALTVLSQVPVLVLCGTRDVVTPIAHSRRLFAALPFAELVAVDGGTHLVHLEQPDAVTAGLVGLFDRARTCVSFPMAAAAVA